MEIAVLSDTHLTRVDESLLSLYETRLAAADFLVHCGDFVGEEVMRFFMSHPGFHGVAGNTDEWAIQQSLPDFTRFQAGPFTVGVTHGWGGRQGMARRVAEAFHDECDLCLFGHQHVFEVLTVGRVVVANPGSARRSRSGPNSMATITLDEGAAEPIRVFHEPLP